MGRQAPGRELRRRRSRQRPPRQGAARGRARRRHRVPHDDGPGHRDAVPRGLVHPRRRGGRLDRARRQPRQGHRQGRPEGPREGAKAHEPGVAVEVRPAGRRWLPDQAAAAIDRAPARREVRRPRADHPPGPRRLRALAVTRPASRARPLPLRGLRPQGRRRRLGRDRSVHGPADGRPRRRPAVPAGQGSGHVRARPVRGRRRIRAAGRAGRSGPARHAGRQRPVPRLGDRDRGAARGSSTSVSCAT